MRLCGQLRETARPDGRRTTAVPSEPPLSPDLNPAYMLLVHFLVVASHCMPCFLQAASVFGAANAGALKATTRLKARIETNTILQQCGRSGLLFGNALVGPASLFCHQSQATIGLGLGAWRATLRSCQSWSESENSSTQCYPAPRPRPSSSRHDRLRLRHQTWCDDERRNGNVEANMCADGGCLS